MIEKVKAVKKNPVRIFLQGRNFQIRSSLPTFVQL